MGVQALDACAQAWVTWQKTAWRWAFWQKSRPRPRGVYLYGSVGRGKSLLMDCFFEAVPVTAKTRLHFHEFMTEVHRELARLQGQANPLSVLGREIAQRHQLICFDEFHIADVTDAMILHRLLVALFEAGVGLVMTSNFHPGALYPNGLHRDRILPAIDLLQKEMNLISLEGPVDYRYQQHQAIQAIQAIAPTVALHPTTGSSTAQPEVQVIPAYFVNDEKGFTAVVRQLLPLSPLPLVSPSSPLSIQGREVAMEGCAEGVAWFRFSALCQTARSYQDYLVLAEQFHTIILSGVPCLSSDQALAARRLTWLVDVLYDRRVRLIIQADGAPETLYLAGPFAHEFARTVSRLVEMQSLAYQQQGVRQVDTRLVN
jgi:cell division protein ZapE